MRIGYAMGSKTLIKALNNAKYSFNSYTMNLPSILCGVESINDINYFANTVDKIKLTREKTMSELANMGFSFPRSMTNFIFAKHDRIPGIKIYEELRNKKIYVRHFNKDKIDNYVRITVGTDEQMETLLKAIQSIIDQE